MILVWVLGAALAGARLVWTSGSDMFFGLLLLVVVGGWGALAAGGAASFVGHPRRAGQYGLSATSVVGRCAFLETGTFAVESFGIAYCPEGGLPGGEPLGGGLFSCSFD